MGVTFSGTQIIQDSPGATYYGAYYWTPGQIEGEWYEKSIPRASGIHETWSGNRRRLHRFAVTWFVASETTLRSAIDAFQATPGYDILSVSDSLSTFSYTWCRLADVQWGSRKQMYLAGTAGSRSTGMMVNAQLTFVQTKVS